MLINKNKIILGFRYFWGLFFLIVIFYIVQENLVITKEVNYQVDLTQNITRDLEGLYPANRVDFSSTKKKLLILGEPLYLQAYVPDDFRQLLVSGNISLNNHEAKLGLKLDNGDWQWQDLTDQDFAVYFPLDQAAIERNRLQLIFSFPDLNNPGEIELANLTLSLQR